MNNQTNYDNIVTNTRDDTAIDIISKDIDSDCIKKPHEKLRNIIWKILINRKMTFEQFSELIFKASIDKGRDQHLPSFRNYIIKMLLGGVKLTYSMFAFLMTDVLNEEIPNDPEVIHISKLGLYGQDLLGQTFNRLTVIECLGPRGNDGHATLYWKCRCICGNISEVKCYALKSGKTKSCGCLQREIVTTNCTKHGMTESREYCSWESMLRRCYNEKYKNYCYYGGRGIIVCDSWRESFLNFYNDMGPRPEGASLDRIDHNGNYEPDNCRWTTSGEQARNKRNNLRFDDGSLLIDFVNENNLHYRHAQIDFHNGLNKLQILEKRGKIGNGDISND